MTYLFSRLITITFNIKYNLINLKSHSHIQLSHLIINQIIFIEA